ncbi:hypothetical protein [Bacillus sp. T3]|uniref:hypothetical protein n=1 Tax=Bacillus sp. T3 TaxID=467262 RepID=UPI002981740B|nr:hypothetical protein [Bacillus sp. T3]
MKGYLSLLFGSFIIALMLIVPGNAAFAEEPAGETQTTTDDCGCDVSMLTGSERNKILSDLLKSDEFKAEKQVLKDQGYKWNGAGTTEVIINHSYGDLIMVGVMFTAEDGKQYAAGFLCPPGGNFIFRGIAPY